MHRPGTPSRSEAHTPTLTWHGADHVEHAPATGPQRALGAVRVGAIVASTAIALPLFMLGKALRARLSPDFAGHFALARLWSRAMLAILGVRLVVVGVPLDGPGVMVANHASWADILALRATRRINFVAKAEVRAWWGVGAIAAACETVFIERRRSAARAQAGQLRARLAQGETLCIFAEGTSSDGLRVLPFKSALLSAVSDLGSSDGVAVQPVTVNWLAPPGQHPAFFGWWGDMGFESHVWTVACRGAGGTVELVFHEPRGADALGDRKALTRWCEQQVRRAKRH